MSNRTKASTGGGKKRPRAGKYDVLVSRTTYGHRTIRVRADSVRDAEEAALGFVTNKEFTTTDAEYRVEAVSKVGAKGR
jgi:hypothetical protein